MPAPRFSIVIPTYNRPESLRNCLSGIAALTADRSTFEVIVVDDASDGDTAAVVGAFVDDMDIVVLHQEENRGPASARNRGAGEARGDYLFFLDDDCIPCRDWLERMGGYLDNRPHVAVGGNSRNGLSESLCSEAQQMLMDYLAVQFNGDPENAGFCATNNLAVPREAFLRLGGFDTNFRRAAGEDREFCHRWIRSGNGLHFTRCAPVYHQHAMGLAEFVKLHYRYGRGARCFHERKAEEGAGRRFEPVRFYTGLVLFPFSQTGALRAAAVCVLQVISQAAHTTGYLSEMLASR